MAIVIEQSSFRARRVQQLNIDHLADLYRKACEATCDFHSERLFKLVIIFTGSIDSIIMIINGCPCR